MSGMIFRPSLHGWPFANTFPDGAHELGLGGPVAGTFGLAGGMCWAALDRYLAGRAVDRTLARPEPGEALFAELLQRQASVLAAGLWRRAVEWQGLPDRGRAGIAGRTRKEWARLRRMLDAGDPVLLCLVRAGAASSSPSENLQVLAYRYDLGRGGELMLWIYDPNRPDDDELRLQLRLGRWRRSLDATLTGGDPVRGFFAIPYDRTRPSVLEAELFSDRSRVTLDRPILGRPAPVLGADGRIHVFGRDGNGNLVQFQRRPAPHWVYGSPTEHRKLGGEQRIHGDPVVVQGPGRGLAVFARNYVGDLIHYRWSRGRGWSAANLTDNRRIGLAFRITGQPAAVVGPGRRLDVFGRTREGHLIDYAWSPVRGWSVEDLMDRRGAGAIGELRGDPVAVVGPGKTQHVFGRNQDGEIVHWERPAGGDWVAERVPVRREDGERVRMAGDPVIAGAGEAGLELFCRGEFGELARLHRARDAGWTARPLPPARAPNGAESRVQTSPVVAAGPGDTLHVFARSDDGDLLHWHRASPGGEWGAENVTASRPAIGDAFRFTGRPVALVGPGIALHVFASSGSGLILYTWRPDSDWTAENLTAERRAIGERYRIAGDPVPLTDRDGLPHLFGTDGAGTVVHIEVPPKRSRRRRRARAKQSQPTAPRRSPPRETHRTGPAEREAQDADEPVPELPLLDPPAPQAEAAQPAAEPPFPEGFVAGSALDGDGPPRGLATTADPPAGPPAAGSPAARPPAEPERENVLARLHLTFDGHTAADGHPADGNGAEDLALDGLVHDPMAAAGPAAQPEALPEALAEALPEALPETLAEALPEALPEALAEALPEALPEAIPEALPEILLDAPIEAPPEPLPDALPGALADAEPETLSAALFDALPDAPPDGPSGPGEGPADGVPGLPERPGGGVPGLPELPTLSGDAPASREPQEPLPALPGWTPGAPGNGSLPPGDDDPVEVQLLDLSELLPPAAPDPPGGSGAPRPPGRTVPTGRPRERKPIPSSELPAWLRFDDDAVGGD